MNSQQRRPSPYHHSPVRAVQSPVSCMRDPGPSSLVHPRHNAHLRFSRTNLMTTALVSLATPRHSSMLQKPGRSVGGEGAHPPPRMPIAPTTFDAVPTSLAGTGGDEAGGVLRDIPQARLRSCATGRGATELLPRRSPARAIAVLPCELLPSQRIDVRFRERSSARVRWLDVV